MKKRISVVIPTLNEERHISACLSSILNCNYDNTLLEVIVVDNGSTDNTRKIAESFPVIVKEKKGVFVGGVRNHGASFATGDILCFLDSDCVVDPEWLNKGLSLLSDISAAGGCYIEKENANWLEKYWILNDGFDVVTSNHLVGGCIFIKKEAFDSADGFNDILNSGEDFDLTNRLRKAGHTVKIDPGLNVIHLGNPDNIKTFLKRQVWHSSDYITQLPSSLTDKIFLVTLVYLFSSISSVIGLVTLQSFTFLSFIVAALCPLLLTLKRVKRSKKRFTLNQLAKIYVIDNLYLLGRIGGISLSLKNLILSPAQKVSRR